MMKYDSMGPIVSCESGPIINLHCLGGVAWTQSGAYYFGYNVMLRSGKSYTVQGVQPL